MVFTYPNDPHRRKHGPKGYRAPESYKPWLRDDFLYRCVYCLCREPWFPDGDAHFSVAHLDPQGRAPERRTDYENLLYTCCQCNAVRQGTDWVLDPCMEALGKHMEVLGDGTIRALCLSDQLQT